MKIGGPRKKRKKIITHMGVDKSRPVSKLRVRCGSATPGGGKKKKMREKKRGRAETLQAQGPAPSSKWKPEKKNRWGKGAGTGTHVYEPCAIGPKNRQWGGKKGQQDKIPALLQIIQVFSSGGRSRRNTEKEGERKKKNHAMKKGKKNAQKNAPLITLIMPPFRECGKKLRGEGDWGRGARRSSCVLLPPAAEKRKRGNSWTKRKNEETLLGNETAYACGSSRGTCPAKKKGECAGRERKGKKAP